MARTILLVDDESIILNSLTRVLSKDGYEIITSVSGENALEILNKNDIQVILTDQAMSEMTGAELLSKVKREYPDIVTMMLSGYTDFDAVKDAINEGSIYKFLSKPWDNALLRHHVLEAFSFYELRIKGKLAAQAINNSIEGMMITDAKGAIIQVNSAFTTITGYAENEALGNKLNLFDDKLNVNIEQRISVALKEKGLWNGEVWKHRKNGEVYPELLSIKAAFDESGQVTQYTHLFLDITKQKAVEQQCDQLMYFDKLTGLSNRSFFMDSLQNAIESTSSGENRVATVLIDIDRFGNINNQFGQFIGNQILKNVAARLKEWICSSTCVARLANDDFAMLLFEAPKTQRIEILINEIVRRLEVPFSISDRQIYITFSIGVSFYPKDSDRQDLLMEKANIALLHSKELGGNNIQFYNSSLESSEQFNPLIETELHIALEREQFKLVYQPIFSFKTQEILGSEALLRWQHPHRGLLVPEQFLPLCESTGLIVPIDIDVINLAIQTLKKWHALGYKELTMTVNLSARHFANPGLLDLLLETVESADISSSCLVFDVPEKLLMRNVENSLILLNSLKEKGCQLALDDFGTGYASLNLLKECPFSILKIDKEFIHEIGRTKYNESLIIAIIAMCKDLGLSIAAEGIESQAQYDFLKEVGCDLGQGELFCKPVSEEEMVLLLTHKQENVINAG